MLTTQELQFQFEINLDRFVNLTPRSVQQLVIENTLKVLQQLACGEATRLPAYFHPLLVLIPAKKSQSQAAYWMRF
jgi:hypothetical protein